MLAGLLSKRLPTLAVLTFVCTVVSTAAGFAISAQAGSDPSVEEIAPRIKQVSFNSDVLGVEKRFCVVLPDGYAADRDDWPWLLLLHGRGRHERSLVDDPRARAALLAAPFVTVLPDGDKSWYVDSPLGRYKEYLEEVLQVASARFGLSGDPSRRAITGWSMGGYGCVRFLQTQSSPNNPLTKGATAGLSSSECRNPRENTAGQASSGTRVGKSRISQRAANGNWQFALVAPIIGLLDYPSDPQGFPAGQSYPVRTEVFGKDSSGWKKFNPIRQAQRLRGTSIMLITADRAFDRTMNERFSRRLGELGTEHELKVLEGTHSLDVVRDALPLVIERTEQFFNTNSTKEARQ